jgi:hypothetical protein
MAKLDPRRSPQPLNRALARATPEGRGLRITYGVLKLAAIVLGLPAAMLCLMSLIGAFSENIYVRVLGALLVLLAVPLFVADRLLPDDPRRGRGLITDVLAVAWLLTAFFVAAVGGEATKPLLTREGDRLVRGGYLKIATFCYFLGGVSATIPAAPQPTPQPTGAASATSATSATGG